MVELEEKVIANASITKKIHTCLETNSMALLNELKEYATYFALRQIIEKENSKKTQTIKIMKEDYIRTYVDNWYQEKLERGSLYKYHLEPILHTAVRHNWLEGVNFLISEGANVNTWSYISDIDPKSKRSDSINSENLRKYQTALHIAVDQDNLEIVNLLLEKKAYVNVAGFEKNPLISCCLNTKETKNRTEIAKKLIAANANVNAKEKFFSPITAALYQEKINQGIVILLLNRSDLKIPQINASPFVKELLKRREYNEKMLPTLLNAYDKVVKDFTKHPFSNKKMNIWLDFLEFYKTNLTLTPQNMIEEWVKSYRDKKADDDPLKSLKIHRREGKTKFFNSKYPRSIKVLKDYINSKELPECMQELERTWTENNQKQMV